jgi:hypothetical protein
MVYGLRYRKVFRGRKMRFGVGAGLPPVVEALRRADPSLAVTIGRESTEIEEGRGEKPEQGQIIKIEKGQGQPAKPEKSQGQRAKQRRR